MTSVEDRVGKSSNYDAIASLANPITLKKLGSVGSSDSITIKCLN